MPAPHTTLLLQVNVRAWRRERREKAADKARRKLRQRKAKAA
jgi:hypothetical protein